MQPTQTHEMRPLIINTLKTYAVFLVVALIAMGITSAVAWLVSLVGFDMWSRVIGVVTGLGSPGALYALFSSWIVLAAVYFSFPNLVHGVFGFATRTLADAWFSVLGALTGFSLVVGVVAAQWGGLLLLIAFALITYAGIFLINKGLNPANFTLPQRLLGSTGLLLLVPLALVFG